MLPYQSSKSNDILEAYMEITVCFMFPCNNREAKVMPSFSQAMENHGLKGHLPQPENFTTCGKLGIEINQYNCPIECYDEAVIEEMTEDREMLTNPELVEKRKDLQSTRVQHDNPLIQQKMMNFDPRKSNVLTTLAAEERDKATRHA